MALKKEALQKIAQLLKIKEADLETAIKDTNEVDIALEEGLVTLTPTELETRDNNMKTAGKKEGEKEGEGKGKELAAKALKKKFGIDGEEKDLDKVVEAVTAKVATGDDGLRQQVQALLKDKESLQNEVLTAKQKADQVVFESQLIGHFPAGRTADLKDTERLIIMKNDLQFETENGKTIVKRNGEIVKDPTTHAPLPPDKVVAQYFEERKWVAAGGEGGRGGGDNNPPGGGGGGIKTMTQAQQQYLQENPGGNLMSPEFTNYVDKLAKDDPSFDIYK
jgi:hypothetical protein